MQKENLPQGWEVTNVEKVFFQISTQGKSIKIKDSSQEGKYPVIDQGEEYISGYCDDENKVISIENSVVVFGDHTRNIKWIDFDFIAGADGIKIFLPKKEIYSRFFYYQLRSFELPNKGYHRHFRYLKEKNFLIPPLSEQTQIATLLDDLLVRVQTIQTRLNKIPELLKQFRQSVLADAVSGRLTEKWREENEENNINNELDRILKLKKQYSKKISEHLKNEEYIIPTEWKWVSLDLITKKIVDGTHHTPTYTESGIPFISVKDIKDGKIDFSDTKFISIEEHSELSKRCLVEKGDLLITKSGTIGRTAIVTTNNEFSLFVSVALIKPISSDINVKFIDIALKKWIGEIDISSRIVGSTIKNLHLKDMKVLAIPFPQVKEQTQIVSMVENYLTLADTIETQTQQALEKVNLLTQSILAKAFRGELTEKWRAENQALISGENSAKALLAKIEAELQAVKKRK